ncbi:MAG: MFS transporter, partial [Candidatus Methanomethylicia archaeon]
MSYLRVTFLGLAHAINHSFLLTIPVLLPSIANSLGIEIYEMGFAVSFAYFLYGFGAILAGPLSKRFSSRVLIFLSLLCSGLSTLLFIFNINVYSFALILALNSFWTSIYHPIANKLISEDFPNNMGRIMGLHGIGGSFGSVFVPLFSVFISSIFDWRYPMIILGLFSILISLAFYGKGSIKYYSKSNISVPYWRIKWIILFSIFIGLFSRGLELFLPSLLIYRGFDQSSAALLMSSLLLSGVFGQFFGGFIADIYGSLRSLLSSFIMVFIGLVMIVLGYGNNVLTLIGVLIYGFAFYAHQPPSTKLQSELVCEEARGYVYGLFFFINFSLGSVSSSLTGWIAGLYGFEYAYLCLSLISSLALAMVFVMFFEYSK